MSDLQADIDLVLQLNSPIKAIREATERVVEAARRVANLDIDAATAVTNQLRFIKDGDEWDDLIHDITTEAVNKALGITEDADA